MTHGRVAALRPGAEPSDEDLVADLAAGRHEALGALYGRYARLVYQIACRSVGAAAAEEIVQDTFLGVWRGAGSFDPSAGSFRPWALRIAHWRILNELRRRQRHPAVRDDDPGDSDGGGPLQRVPDSEPWPEETAWRDEQAELVRAALDSLSPKQRQAVALAFLGDLSHAQVADQLGVPLGTAKTRIRDGLVHLRSVLAPLAATLVLVFAVGAGIVRWVEQEHDLRLNQRAVGVLTSSDTVAIRVGAVDPAMDMHGTYRVEPGTDVAIFSVSHVVTPPAGQHYVAEASIDGQWRSLGTFDSNTVLIEEGAPWGTPPEAIRVRIEPSDQVVLDWHA